MCRFIERHFTIDWLNSADVSQRLRATEFGYRSVHYIVSFKPDVFPTSDVPLEVPGTLLQGLPENLFESRGPDVRPLRAEVQVRTLLEHAWADIGHELIYKSSMQVPTMEKIVINVGIGEAAKNAKLLESVIEELRLITGQQPVTRRAKKAISNFSLREGMPAGVSVTLRRERMWEFLDRLITIALPRVRAFRGVNGPGFGRPADNPPAG
jgi:ribosomal protein L5